MNVEWRQGYDNYQQCLRVLLQKVYGGLQEHAVQNLALRLSLQVNVELFQDYYNYQLCLRVLLQTV